MPVTRPNPEKLATVLKGVSPTVARFVVREIEFNRRRGQDEPIYEMVLNSARGVIRQSGEKVDRVQTPKRLFCSFFEEFLVDRSLSRLQRGRIERASIEPIWDWLNAGWGPDDLSPIVAKMDAEIKRKNPAGVAPLARELCSRAASAIRKGIAAVQGDAEAQRRLGIRLGGSRILKDAVQIQRILCHMPTLVKVRSVIPNSTVLSSDEKVQHLADILRQGIADVPKHPELAIALVLGRLSRPVDITRIIVQVLGVNDGGRIQTSAYAPAIDILVYDMGLLGLEIIESLKERKGIAATLYWLSQLHEYSAELMDRVDISLKSEWGKSLLGVRNGVSAQLNSDISQIPLKLKELYRPRPDFSQVKVGGRNPDPMAVFEATHGLAMMVGCRPYLDQLSLNQVISTTETEVRRYLRVLSDAILNDVRSTKGAQQHCALAWFETAVQCTRIVFSDEDAKLLARSGQVAARAEAS